MLYFVPALSVGGSHHHCCFNSLFFSVADSPFHRCFSSFGRFPPTDIDTLYAAVASGIPEAVPAVLGCIRDGQAEAELKARNAWAQLDPTRIRVGLGTSNRGGGGGVSAGTSSRSYGSGGGVGASSRGYGGVVSGREEELETLAMLAAGSGNWDMFKAVLLAMRQKLRTEHQVRLLRQDDERLCRVLAALIVFGFSTVR